jgi:hypothetical protein
MEPLRSQRTRYRRFLRATILIDETVSSMSDLWNVTRKRLVGVEIANAYSVVSGQTQ